MVLREHRVDFLTFSLGWYASNLWVRTNRLLFGMAGKALVCIIVKEKIEITQW